MESHDVVASLVLIMATLVGLFLIYMKQDGTILEGLIGLYGVVLGFVFGYGYGKNAKASEP